MVNVQKNKPSFDMTTTQVKRVSVVEMETTSVPTQKTTTEDTDKLRTLLACGPIPGEELSYADLAELRQPLEELPDLFRWCCVVVDDRKGTIAYDNVYNTVIFIQNREPVFFKTYDLQCDNFHHEYGGSGKGHRLSDMSGLPSNPVHRQIT